MSNISNITGISLPLAVWLCADGYDFNPGDEKAISVTALMKPVRQILLKERLRKEDRDTIDVADLIASRTGHAIHDSIEKAWVQDYKSAMRALGYPQKLIDNIRVNPTEPLKEGEIPIWVEQRGYKTFMGYKITGKFDQVFDGELNDTKSTSVYTYLLGSKDEDYCLQGSLYRWIHPDKITSDYININFFFTDWQRSRARQSNDYPQQRLLTHRVNLMSIQETEAWVRNKLLTLEKYADAPEEELPFCTEKELWRSDPVFKFYLNPKKTSGRATKNCETMQEALEYKASKGGKGVIIETPGKVKACSYCAVFNICKQKDQYEID